MRLIENKEIILHNYVIRLNDDYSDFVNEIILVNKDGKIRYLYYHEYWIPKIMKIVLP